MNAIAVSSRITASWRSFWNGPAGTRGSIAGRFGVRGQPAIYLLDSKGAIRFVNKRGAAMDKAVDTLLAEMNEGK